MDERTIGLGGDWEHADFVPAVAWIREQFCALPLPAGEEAGAPFAIVIAQSRPGQIERRTIEEWHARTPLARLVALTGPWCEGEQRSGRPWPGGLRVPWRTWRTALPRALGLTAGGPALRLPRTATETDRLEREIAGLRLPPVSFPGGSIAIRTFNRVCLEGLEAALTRLGVSIASNSADLELIDGWEQWPAGPGPRRLLLLHFPRPDDVARAEQAGAAAVLVQPVLLADLAAVLDSLLPNALTAEPRLPSVA